MLRLAMQRLVSISWQFDYDRLPLYVVLMKEYLRRIALWATALDLDPSIRAPFFDVADVLVPAVPVPQRIVDELQVQLRAPTLVVKNTCIYYVHWTLIQARPEVAAFQLPAPYEPLIRMYERGGSFWTEHGFIEFGGAAIPLRNWARSASSTPHIALDDTSLDTWTPPFAWPPLAARAPEEPSSDKDET